MDSTKVKEKTNQVLPSTDLVRTYLKEIGKIPLLEHSEEIILGKQVQHMMSLIAEKEKLEKQKGEVLSHQEWAKAVGLTPKQLKQVLTSCSVAKKKMIRSNLRLVVAIAPRLSFALDRQEIYKLDAEKWGEFLPKKASAAFLKPYYC